jgi:serine/threonine protein kinase
MTPHEQVSELLSRYEELCRQGSAPSLEEFCRACPSLLDELRRRLEQRRANAPTAPHPGTMAATPAPPESRGRKREWKALALRYEPLRFHAEGGLGEVWVARDAELKREVALKRIRQDRDGSNPETLRRFLLEAEIAGRMEHPGVVPVHGLSHDAEGTPCYAMRFIQGETLGDAIKAYHDAAPGRDEGLRRIAFRDLLGRFVAVCKTVAYAHSRGIIHRDIKPGNIMLGKYGETLVVDWGLAKSVERGEQERATGEDTLQPEVQSEGDTIVGVPLGSPAYMSPEQADGRWQEVGPACDIYCLGGTLYTILTGKPPREGRTNAELLCLARDGAIPSPRQLRRDVPRPLEVVCLKAMAPRPQDRYASALELADEVERWLADEPVRAYREPLSARTRRWVRQHRAAFTAAMTGVAALALALGIASVFLASAYDRERTFKQQAEDALERERVALGEVRDREAQAKLALENERRAKDDAKRFGQEALAKQAQAKQVSDALISLFQVSDPIGLNGYPLHFAWEKGMDLTARELLDRAAMATERIKDPLLRASQMDALGNVYRSLGQYGRAEELLRAAYTIRSKEHDVPPADLAASMFNLGWLRHDQGFYAEARDWYRKALDIRKERFGEGSEPVAATKLNLAWVMVEHREHAAAEPLFREVIDEYANLFGEGSREVALARAGLAALIFDEARAERLVEAKVLVTQAAETFARVDGDDSPSEALALYQNGMLALRTAEQLRGGLRENLLKQAEENMGKCQEFTRRWLGNEHPLVAVVLHDYACVAAAQGRADVAEKYFRECLDVADRSVGFGHPRVLIGVTNFADFLREQNRPREAEPLYEKMIVARTRRFGPDHAYVAEAHQRYGVFLQQSGSIPRARDEYALALAIWNNKGARPPEYAATCARAGILSFQTGRLADAERLCRDARELFGQPLFKDDGARGFMSYMLGRTLMARGKYGAADEQFAEARSLLRAAGKPREQDLLVTLYFSGKLAAARGRFEDAEALFREARPLALVCWPNQPGDRAALLEELGGALLDLKRYDDAAAVFEEAAAVVGGQGPAGVWSAAWRCRKAAALARLAGGDAAAYRDFCRRATQELGKSPDAFTLATLAWLYAVTSEAGSTLDAVNLAERALRTDERNAACLLTGGRYWTSMVSVMAAISLRSGFYEVCQGAALYRAGRWAEAAQALEETVVRHPDDATAYGWLFLAMAQKQLGRIEEARQAFERARRWLKSVDEPDLKDPDAVHKIGCQDRVQLALLLREAETMLGIR